MTAVISLPVIAALTAVDQLIKYFVELRLEPIGSLGFIDGFVGWKYVRNTGAAFGTFSNSTDFLSVFTGVVLLAWIVLIILKKIKPTYCVVCSVMIISGGLGNLIDRVFRGYVVDFIEVQFVDFAVFNFADMLVTCGAFMLIGYSIYGVYKDYKHGKATEDGNG